MSYLLASAAGIFLVAFFPSLPSVPLYLVLVAAFALLLAVVTVVFRKSDDLVGRLIASHALCLALGIGWGIMSGHQLLDHQLPDSLDKQQFLITGTVVGLVDNQPKRQRFNFEVNTTKPLNFNAVDGVADSASVKNLLLSWYQFDHGKNKYPNRQIRSGDQWQLLVRLRKPRGMRNAGGFDYQAWLVEQGYSATGYIVDSSLNWPLQTDSFYGGETLRVWISRLRAQIREAIANSQLSHTGKAVVSALTIGDKTGLDNQWDDLVRWGIIHLMVISGLHIGLVASLGFYLGLLLNRPLLLFSRVSKGVIDTTLCRFLPPLLGFISALIYSALAGFSLPTQRAMIAVAVVMLTKLIYRKLPVQYVFAWAFLLIALSQPLAVLSASFWLSFAAVAILLLWFSPWFSVRKQWHRLLSAQLALFAGMAVLGIGFMGHFSWLAPVINLVAVPWISLITVPLCLLGLLSYFFIPSLTSKLWLLADGSINGLWYVLESIPKEIGLVYLPIPVTGFTLASILIASFALLIPRGIPLRWLCLVPIILLILVPLQRPPLRITVLDVGQGLAVVVELPSHLLVYDSGPAYSDQFDAGSGVVAPFLRRRGYLTVDKLLISHEDNDHAGGFYGLLDSIPVEQALLGPGFLPLYKVFKEGTDESLDIELNKGVMQCDNTQRWSWSFWNPLLKAHEAIDFYVLMPNPIVSPLTSRNNSSCVLLIQWRDQRVLLTGDIEKKAEKDLLKRYQMRPVTLMVAPHHGSKTSSSAEFVETLRPTHVVFSAGHRHHFGHPHPSVVKRYQTLGSSLWNTAEHGGITFTWQYDGQLGVEANRSQGWQFWWR